MVPAIARPLSHIHPTPSSAHGPATAVLVDITDCDAFRGIDIQSLNEIECCFLLDVLRALARGPATLPVATRDAARSSLNEVSNQLRRLEDAGLVGHKSHIKSGHLVPEFFLSERGRQVLERARRTEV